MDEFPIEILEHIFLHIHSPKTVIQVALTCKLFNAIIQNIKNKIDLHFVCQYCTETDKSTLGMVHITYGGVSGWYHIQCIPEPWQGSIKRRKIKRMNCFVQPE